MKKCEIIRDVGPAAAQKCPNMHLGPVDEVQVASEAHKFQESSRDQRLQRSGSV